MAPTNASAKTRRSGTNKATGPKSIVPAIPLPHVKRQAAARAAAAAAASAKAPAPALESASTPSEVSSPTVKKVNGSVASTGPIEATESANAINANATSSDAKVTTADDGGVAPSNEVQFPQNDQYEGPDSATTTDSPVSSAPAAQPEKIDHTQVASPTPDREQMVQDIMPTSAQSSNTRAEMPSSETKPAAVTGSTVKQDKARPPAPISPARYQMPPPFHPTNRLPPGIAGNGDANRGPQAPLPNGHLMHHSHPSNGSAVHFGTFNGSASSSPAPPHSGGIAPPPGMQMNDGRHPFMGPPGIGYPPMMPMPNDGGPIPHYDGYTRPGVGYVPPEGYQAHINHFGPSTPHSLQGSQSSGHVDDGSASHTYHPGHSRGVNGFSQDYHGHHPNDRMLDQDPSRIDGPHGSRQLPQSVTDDSDGLLDYIRPLFGSSDWSDTVVELRYWDNRAPPVRVPGHRLVLARTPAFTTAQVDQPGQQHAMVLTTDSKWIRSDAFYMALQRLYGLPLLPVPPPMSGVNGRDFVDMGSLEDRLDFALAYAAAGHLLQWEPVLRRGCEVAAQLLSWQTLTKALQFALEQFVDKGTYETFKYGSGSKTLLQGVVRFIASNLPPTFVLDTKTPEAPFSRLPLDPGVNSDSSAVEETESVVRVAQNGRAMKGHRHQLSNIQFGDLSLMEGPNGSVSDTPKASQQARPVSHAILSQVLISLPFSILQMIFGTTGPGNTAGRVSIEARTRLLKDLVAEREARRSRVIQSLKDGRVVDRFGVLQQLRSPEPRDLEEWGVLGWQEETLSHGSLDGPPLGRRWVPDREGAEVAIAEFP
ncbi:hypothetical protein LIA77_09139 [Sarocladium implicatum]|nr:hypothetical protein LIA77_09139 [Sarocladium implicatum]